MNEIYTNQDDSNEAIQIFMERIVSRAYDGSIKGVRKWLEVGPSRRGKQEDIRLLHDWYMN